MSDTPHALFAGALVSHGPSYRTLEHELRAGGPPVRAALEIYRGHADLVVRLLASVICRWLDGESPEDAQAFELLDALPARVEGSPIPAPPPLPAAEEMFERFGPGAADALALRLLKDTDAARWRVLAIIQYLRLARAATTTGALIRFAADTHDERARACAIEAIEQMADPDLPAKLAAERDRARAHLRELPPPLVQLDPRTPR